MASTVVLPEDSPASTDRAAFEIDSSIEAFYNLAVPHLLRCDDLRAAAVWLCRQRGPLRVGERRSCDFRSSVKQKVRSAERRGQRRHSSWSTSSGGGGAQISP